MENWPHRMKLFAVLLSVKVLLETTSKNEGWSFESPEDSLAVINNAIVYFQNSERNKFPADISMHFAPTGPLQEISMSSGWDKVFLILAEEYDKYAYCLNEKKTF
jgi:hypothetical protein